MAQGFKQITFDPQQCRIEIDEFGALLKNKTDLSEKSDVQPFFKAREQLSGFIGSYMRNIGPATEIGFEYQFYGDFAADLVVGVKAHRRFCVIEFEDGRTKSIFKSSQNNKTKIWSPRFEHGFSQIVDWYSMLDDLKKTQRFKRDFGDVDLPKFRGRSEGEHNVSPRSKSWADDDIPGNSKSRRSSW